jgi:predicted  nucleic acid-binding Zn-ribbon protein
MWCKKCEAWVVNETGVSAICPSCTIDQEAEMAILKQRLDSAEIMAAGRDDLHDAMEAAEQRAETAEDALADIRNEVESFDPSRDSWNGLLKSIKRSLAAHRGE